MRIAFLGLLLANLVAFGWSQWLAPGPTSSPAAVRPSSGSGPARILLANERPATSPAAGTVSDMAAITAATTAAATVTAAGAAVVAAAGPAGVAGTTPAGLSAAPTGATQAGPAPVSAVAPGPGSRNWAVRAGEGRGGCPAILP